MIRIEKLSFSYSTKKDGANSGNILTDISFNAQDGRVVGILGNNGAGKSTLITCINRIRKPTSGTVYIDGRKVNDMKPLEISRNLAYVAQTGDTGHITVFDSVLLGRKPYIKWKITSKDIDICAAMIDKIGLSDIRLRFLDEISGGERQKAMLARALVQNPRVLLLDEPTSSLDPRNQHEVLKLVRSIATDSDITVLMVIHDLNLALKYCDDYFFIKDGKGHAFGPTDVIESEMIRDVYGINAHIIDTPLQKVVVFTEEEI